MHIGGAFILELSIYTLYLGVMSDMCKRSPTNVSILDGEPIESYRRIKDQFSDE